MSGRGRASPSCRETAAPAVFLLVWFASNLLFGLAAAPLGITDAAVAWEAHIGGFVVGLLLFPWLDRR